MDNEIRVGSWAELQEKLFEGSWKPELNRFRSPYAFRGVPEATHRLETTLVRLGGNYAEMEKHLLRNFRKYASRNEVEIDNIWNWLSLAKHHGLPTRLLDWSFSPYVALHFATENINNYDCDGAIWTVDYANVHAHLPDLLKSELKKEGADVFTANMLVHVSRSLQEFDQLSDEVFVVFFEPPSIDERIINQFALFSLMSSPKACLDEWLIERPDLFRKIIFPAELKWEVRDKLDQANITERVLFPGLDGLSAWLKRQYHQRG
ncbi:MAG: FRG domain-containing protein [Chloroflexota bacterium]|nr:MAG: FRG domain-containing protein [Chloroflexota bacterium]